MNREYDLQCTVQSWKDAFEELASEFGYSTVQALSEVLGYNDEEIGGMIDDLEEIRLAQRQSLAETV